MGDAGSSTRPPWENMSHGTETQAAAPSAASSSRTVRFGDARVTTNSSTSTKASHSTCGRSAGYARRDIQSCE